MGLSHNIDLDTGTSAKHFRISNMQLYPETGVADITVEGYINHGAYQTGKKPVYSGSFRMPMGADLTQEQVYTYLKTTPVFTGAVDQ